MNREFNCYTPAPYFDFRDLRQHNSPCSPHCDNCYNDYPFYPGCDCPCSYPVIPTNNDCNCPHKNRNCNKNFCCNNNLYLFISGVLIGDIISRCQ